MGIQIGAKPDSGFDDPIGMLVDCHRRIENFLRILCVAVERAGGRNLAGEEREAVEASLSYFRDGGQRHTVDEEESLFPRLRAASGDVELGDVAGLESDHQRANEIHGTVEELYRTWIAEGRLSSGDEEKLSSETRKLQRLYEEHIRIEEREVFPRAAGMLDAQAIEAMGDEFRARRQ